MQRAQPGIGVGQVVQHAGADHVLEALAELRGALHFELAHFEVGECVLALQLLRERDALGADVDPDDPGAGPPHRIVGGLGGAAAGHQDAAIVAEGFGRPEQMGVGASALVVPEFPVGLQVVHRRRVRVTFVKGAHLPGDGDGGRHGNVIVVHDRLEPFLATLNQLDTDKKALSQTSRAS